MYRALCIYTAFAGPGENAAFEASGDIWLKPRKVYFGKMTKSPGTHEIPELLTMVRMFITNLKSILKIRLKAHIFPRTFADLPPLCYDNITRF